MEKKNEISIKQLPVLEYDALFNETKEEINKAIQFTQKDFIVTKENKVEIKESRTSLRNRKTELNDQFKAIKEKVFAPWDVFEKKFKEELINPLTEAEQKVKVKVDEIEDNDKKEKREESEVYFAEYVKQMELENEDWGCDLSFINYDMVDINITLSISDKKLKEIPKEFVDMIVGNLRTISVMPEAPRFYAEYKKLIVETEPKLMGKVLDNALLNVNKALKIEAEEKEKAEAIEMERIRKENEEARNKAIEGTSFAEPLTAPTALQQPAQEPETVVAITPEQHQEAHPVQEQFFHGSAGQNIGRGYVSSTDEKLYNVGFRVIGVTKAEASDIKKYLESKGYKYESI